MRKNLDSIKPSIAHVILHSSEFVYPDFFQNGGSLDDFNQIIVAQHEGFTAQLTRATMMAGFRPTVYYLSQYAKRPSFFKHKYGYDMKCLPVTFIKGKIGWEYSLALCTMLKKDKPQVVHIHGYSFNDRIPDMYDFLAFFLKYQRIPFVAHFHGAKLDNLRTVRCLIKKFALQSAGWIVCCNQGEVERLTNPGYPGYYKFIRVDPRRVEKIENPLDLKLFKPISRQEGIARLGVDSAQRFILTISRLEEFKGIQDIISILPGLTNDIALIIVGDGRFRTALQEQVLGLGLSRRVIFTGFIPHDRLPYYFGVAEVFVLPSRYEGLPAVIQEALSCRKTVIATKVGGVPELLSDGVGIMVPPSDPPALLEAIRQVVNREFSANWPLAESRLQSCELMTVANKLKKVYLNVLENNNQ